MYPPQGVGARVVVREGIRRLSELEIDVDKDWRGYRIRNVGAPIDDTCVPRARAEDILSGVFSVDRIPDLPRSKVADLWSAPFWENIPDKPLTFPPSAHSHDASEIVAGVLALDRIPDVPRSKITDLFTAPFWENIPDRPSTFPPSPHGHDASDVVTGVLSPDRIPDIPSDKIADGAITTAKIADGAVTRAKIEAPLALTDVTLESVTADPALRAGRIWLRSDLSRIRFSPDGTAVLSLPIGTINVDAHASRHLSGGPDAITGWISPSEIGPRSDSDAALVFRTLNIAGTASIHHSFRPSTDSYGLLGTPLFRFYDVYSRNLNVWSLGTRSAGSSFLPLDAFTHHSLVPRSDGYSYVGTATNRFNLVRAVTVTAGDLGFEERKCLVCGREFKEGDSVVLKVRKVDGDDLQMLCVPVHAECNPHHLDPKLLEEHEERLKPNRGRLNEVPKKKEGNPVGEGEYEVVSATVEDEETMMVNAVFWDGTSVSVPVPVDADEELVHKKVVKYYHLTKEREREIEERRRKGMAKLKRDWRGFKGRVE